MNQLQHLTPLGVWENSPNTPFKAIQFNTDKPFVGQIISESPLVFTVRGKNSVSSKNLQGGKFTYSPNIDENVVNFLGGEDTGIGGLVPPKDFPIPPNYEFEDGIYSPIEEILFDVIVPAKLSSLCVKNKLLFGVNSEKVSPLNFLESDGEKKLSVIDGETIESESGELYQYKQFQLPKGKYYFYAKEKNSDESQLISEIEII